MSPSGNQAGERRQCVHCGKLIAVDLTQCPFCREAIPQVRLSRLSRGPDGRAQVRRGLLYMLMAAVIHYFAGGYSSLKLPVQVAPLVTQYLSPLLFLGGLGLTLYGFYLRAKS